MCSNCSFAVLDLVLSVFWQDFNGHIKELLGLISEILEM